MPISPDLKTSISYDYGVSSQEGIDGSTFENVNWSEPRRLPNGSPVFYVDDTYDPDLSVERNLLDIQLKGQNHYVFIKENGKAQVVFKDGQWIAEHIRTAI